MGQVVTIGLDLAKSVFQVHGVDAAGEVIVRRQIRRGQLLQFFAKQPQCLVGMEACASSHHWARQLLALGHEVKLMPAQYVKPYVKRGKNDAADAEAICEAVARPTMRFVAIKTPAQQSAMMLHRVRLVLNRQRTQLSNAIRAHLGEFGNVLLIRGRAMLEQSDLATAERFFAAADAAFEQISSIGHRAEAWVAQGDLARCRGDLEAAAARYRKAATALQDIHL